jgi:hypothetical protein
MMTNSFVTCDDEFCPNKKKQTKGGGENPEKQE